MSTLTEARSALVAAIRSASIREANLSSFPYAENSSVTFPRISIEINEIRYYQTIGVCKRAEVSGVIRLEVAAQTAEDLSNLLDEYLDPYDDTSVVAVLMAAATPGGSLMTAMDTFIATSANYVALDVAEIPFEFHVSSPT